MQGSSTKTCYIRAGKYTPVASGGCQFNNPGGTMVSLGPSDSGETWSYYPPDGYNSASIDGQSTAAGVGAGCAFEISGGAHNITINGLYFKRYRYSAVLIEDGGGSNIIKNNIVDTTTTDLGIANGYYAAGIEDQCADNNPGSYTMAGDVIQNNVVMNTVEAGIRVQGMTTGTSGSSAQCLTSAGGPVIANNFVLNSCTVVSDCGALYLRDVQAPSGTPMKVFYNYVRDVNRTKTLDASGFIIGVGVYFDGGVLNAQVFGNIWGNPSGGCVFMGGASNAAITGNICDMAAANNTAPGHTNTILRIGIGSPDEVNGMSGNVFSNNIIVMNSNETGNGYWSDNSGENAVSVYGNNYYNYGSAGLINYSCSPGACGASGTSTTQDNSPIYGNPQISCWGSNIASGSPVFNSPVYYQSPGMPSNWNTPGYWGPPGYTGWYNPSGATAPSWPHSC
jgi:hypothetical protein